MHVTLSLRTAGIRGLGSFVCCTHEAVYLQLVQVDLPEGQLVIQPLRERWLQRTGDLLADTFVDAKGIQPYRHVYTSSRCCRCCTDLWHLTNYKCISAAEDFALPGRGSTCIFSVTYTH